MKLEVDLLKYGDLRRWNPKVGDTIFKDGLMFRWCCVVTGVKDDKVYVRKSGNVHLLTSGDFKEEVVDIKKIKNSMVGSYFAVSDGTYYV